MQINRTQNQPNFKADVKMMSAKTMAKHLKGKDAAEVAAKREEIKKIGDKNVGFAVGYTPKNLGPFMILSQQKNPKTGEMSVKFKDGIHLSDLVNKAQKMHEEMSHELGSEPVYPVLDKSHNQVQRDMFTIIG